MSQKSNLLKELGWDDALIKHYMVDESEYVEIPHTELEVEIFDSNSLTINYNTLSSGTSAILTVNGAKIVPTSDHDS